MNMRLECLEIDWHFTNIKMVLKLLEDNLFTQKVKLFKRLRFLVIKAVSEITVAEWRVRLPVLVPGTVHKLRDSAPDP